jgi:hypothetical protein
MSIACAASGRPKAEEKPSPGLVLAAPWEGWVDAAVRSVRGPELRRIGDL